MIPAPPNEAIVVHTANSWYTIRTLESIGSGRRVHLWDGSPYAEMKHYAARQSHINYLRPAMAFVYEGGVYRWAIPTHAASWNEAIQHVQSEWAYFVCPDVFLDSAALPLMDLLCAHPPAGADLVLTTYSRDARPSFDFFAARKGLVLEFPFSEKYAPCGCLDDDFLVRMIDGGHKWFRAHPPMHHMDGGHKTRADEVENSKRLFRETHGYDLGGEEFWEKVNAAEVCP